MTRFYCDACAVETDSTREMVIVIMGQKEMDEGASIERINCNLCVRCEHTLQTNARQNLGHLTSQPDTE